jgi:hypothetical protein
MSNSATAQTAMKLLDKRSIIPEKTMTPIVVVIDTPDTALTIATPGTDNRIALIGMEYAEGDAHNLTILSDTTELCVYQMPANSGISLPLGDDIQALCITAKGKPLVFKSSVAIAKMLVYVVEVTD